MAREILLPRVQQLIQPTSEANRLNLLSRLRSTKTDIDGRRSMRNAEWRKGDIWFHSLQDTGFVDAFAESTSGRHFTTSVQACFTKDLDLYLSGMPPSEQQMREVFEAIYQVGTSFYWAGNIPLFREFHRTYKEVATRIIEPWVKN